MVQCSHSQCRGCPHQFHEGFPADFCPHRGNINGGTIGGHIVEDVPNPLESVVGEHGPVNVPPDRSNHVRVAYEVGQHLTFQTPGVGNLNTIHDGCLFVCIVFCHGGQSLYGLSPVAIIRPVVVSWMEPGPTPRSTIGVTCNHR